MRARITELIRLLGLEAAAEKPIAGYSSGMKQRLALARGLIAEPEVLILDEPTRALDPVACEVMIEMIMDRVYQDARKTLFIATHRLEEVLKLCNKVMVIDRGQIRSFDCLDDLDRSSVSLSQYYRQNVIVETR